MNKKTSGNQQKLKELLNFRFRQRQTLAMGLQEQGAKQEKFKTTIDASLSQWVMTGVNAPLQISQEQ